MLGRCIHLAKIIFKNIIANDFELLEEKYLLLRALLANGPGYASDPSYLRHFILYCSCFKILVV